jgi:hypothetical protein
MILHQIYATLMVPLDYVYKNMKTVRDLHSSLILQQTHYQDLHKTREQENAKTALTDNMLGLLHQ